MQQFQVRATGEGTGKREEWRENKKENI
jgi:hypothetical protein